MGISMKVCPKCRKVVDFNSYFGAYICDECGWEDNSYSRERTLYYSQRKDSNRGRVREIGELVRR
jgi:anaerobic ribonucleoside-triphosphate reductase